MKIATMVRGYIPLPRPSDMIYAPMDIAVALSEGLKARGHDITVFGPIGTKLETSVETLNLRPLVRNHREYSDLISNPGFVSHGLSQLWDLYMTMNMFERASRGEFDLIHLHHPETALPYAKLYPDVPVVYTLHDPVEPWLKELLEMYGSKNQYYVSISDNQRLGAPDLKYVETVYNGIDTKQYRLPEVQKREDFLLFCGRIVPEKGVKEAIAVAQQTGLRLLIIGPTIPEQQDYFDQYIRPHLNDKVLYLGFMEREQLIPYFQKAKALLCPVMWEEPFGMTMAEAMACGAPVIAFRKGSIPEIVDDGRTGYIVDSIADMTAAVAKLDNIDSRDCHALVEKRFSNGRMVNQYIQAFQKALGINNRKIATSNKI